MLTSSQILQLSEEINCEIACFSFIFVPFLPLVSSLIFGFFLFVALAACRFGGWFLSWRWLCFLVVILNRLNATTKHWPCIDLSSLVALSRWAVCTISAKQQLHTKLTFKISRSTLPYVHVFEEERVSLSLNVHYKCKFNLVELLRNKFQRVQRVQSDGTVQKLSKRTRRSQKEKE